MKHMISRISELKEFLYKSTWEKSTTGIYSGIYSDKNGIFDVKVEIIQIPDDSYELTREVIGINEKYADTLNFSEEKLSFICSKEEESFNELESLIREIDIHISKKA